MPYNFHAQHEYNINILDIIRFYKIPGRYRKQIIENYSLVSEIDHKCICELVSIQKDVKQVFDIFIPITAFSSNSNEHISFSFNVDKILNFIESYPINTEKVNVNLLVSNISTQQKLSSSQFNTKSIITGTMFTLSVPPKPLNFTIDGNHRVTYCKQNDIEELSCVHLNYEILKIFNPFDSHSEYYLYILFWEILNYYQASWIEKSLYKSRFFEISSFGEFQIPFESTRL